MAITYPINLLPGFPGWTTGFRLRWRQEQSTQASGRILVKDMGAPLWTLRAATKMLSPNNLDAWRAQADRAGKRPADVLGLSDDAVLSACLSERIMADRRRVHRADRQPGRDQCQPQGDHAVGAAGRVCAVGRRLHFDHGRHAQDLHQVMEAATAAAGITPQFEMRPHLWPDVTVTKAGVRSSNRPA